MAVKRWREFHRTPHDQPMDTIVSYCRQAKHSLHGDVYGFTYKPLAQAFIDLHKAGLEVGLVVDSTQAAGTYQHPVMQWMVDEGVPVTITRSPDDSQINHDKNLLVDAVLGADANESYAIYGSLNFSKSGPEQANHVCVDNDPTIVAALYQQYIEAQAFGAKHCKQLVPTTAQPPTVPPDVAAAANPPEATDAAS